MIWGANYTIAKRALAEIDALAVAFARALVAVLCFAVILTAREGRAALVPARLRRAAPLGLLGVFGNQILFITGLQRTSAAHSAILIAAMPICVLLISVLAGGETLRLRRTAGILLAFAGVAGVVLEKGIDFRSEYLAGDLITLGSVLAFAGYTVAGRPVARDLGPLRSAGLAFLTGGVAILLVAAPAAARQEWLALSGGALWSLAYTVVLSTIVAYPLYFRALSRIDPSQVAAFAYLQVVFATLVSVAVAGERLSGQFLLGGGLILGGVLLAERP
jgi:drug/metabolite transporter (DMT)-like permease